MIVSFSDQEQQEVEGIVIDKDGDEALRYLSDLVENSSPVKATPVAPKPPKLLRGMVEGPGAGWAISPGAVQLRNSLHLLDAETAGSKPASEPGGRPGFTTPLQALPSGASLIQDKVKSYGRQTDRIFGPGKEAD